ncbi:glutamyl-tRNA synthetase [Hymenopellis radicata]|nr:glutamyl-tRNA synthetase [Hymenopellis radicata]
MALLRFAPSPTGPLHFGGLRMALYNHLVAKKLNGKWILRIEDTDSTRSVPGSVDGIRQALAWAGLEYDYGPEKDNSLGPYFQTERLDLYKSYANRLLDSGHAYRCFCSVDKLNDIRERLARSGSSISYDKTCTHISEEESNRKARAGEKFVVRINNSHAPERPAARDLVFGRLKDAHASLSTDSVLLKSDGFPTYHLASVADDHEMGITHVLRGEEWITSLPLHLDLYAHLKLTPPLFAHIPILLNPDGTKMSKRHGDVQVLDYMRRGWEPSAILNWLALAGWGAKHHEVPSSPSSPSSSHPVLVKDKEAPESTAVMTMDQMIDAFDLEMLTQRSSGLDPGKLEYLNRHHLMMQWTQEDGLQKLAERVHERVKEAFPLSKYTSLPMIKRVIQVLEQRITNLQDLPILSPYFFIEPDLTNAEAQRMLSVMPSEDERRAMLGYLVTIVDAEAENWDAHHVFDRFAEEQARSGIKRGHFYKVLRAYLTGMKDGPPLVDVMSVLGPERTRLRLTPSSD